MGRSDRPAGGELRLRVLLADDNPLNPVYQRELLRRLGHDVVMVTDVEEASRLLSRESFSLLLMDVQMPKLDGDEGPVGYGPAS